MKAEDDSGSARENFLAAFRQFAATVSLVTYWREDGRPAGITITSLCSLSPAPPSLLVCIDRRARSHDEIVAAGRFGVNVLGEGQRRIAELCSRPGARKQLWREWLLSQPPPPSPPLLRDALARLDCRLDKVVEDGTHSILIGRLEAILLGSPAAPLLYWDRAYRAIDAGTRASLEDVWERVAFGALS